MARRGIGRFRTEDFVQGGGRQLDIGAGRVVFQVKNLSAHHHLLSRQLPVVLQDLGVVHGLIDPGELMLGKGGGIEDIAGGKKKGNQKTDGKKGAWSRGREGTPD
jgi:hypothetical protein